MKPAVIALCLATLLPVGAAAQDRQLLGLGTIFDNDYLGDGHDRWRSGAYTFSAVTGPEWQGAPPVGFGELIEYRIRGEILTPANLTHPAPDDRRYAGVLSFGAHSHFSRGPVIYSLGADLVLIGPQTGVGDFQSWAHDLFGASSPDAATANQIGNEVYPTLLFSATRPVALSARTELRPFVEAQVGVETYVRIGGDLIWGGFNRSDLMLRDVTTGHLYDTTHSGGQGFALTLGGDVAFVNDSAYLKSSDGVTLRDTRTRLRAGVDWQVGRVGAFYGLTWLSKEFTAQSASQVVGTVNLRWQF